MRSVRILFVGDIMGSPGRRAASRLLEGLRSRLDCRFVIVNGENAAGGLGITRPTAAALFCRRRRRYHPRQPHVREARRGDVSRRRTKDHQAGELSAGSARAGDGACIETAAGENVAVVSLMGRTFMDPVDCPFRAADAVLAEIGGPGKDRYRRHAR